MQDDLSVLPENVTAEIFPIGICLNAKSRRNPIDRGDLKMFRHDEHAACGIPPGTSVLPASSVSKVRGNILMNCILFVHGFSENMHLKP